ncbi:hypothetical protein [Bowmanella denitrificans]|uniref:hypothetical protein n=1 Tax=Bowmanella denitrificans TaxID=366582 RepID=UPI000C9C5292|nr:hypothetical protein [Bowmanella denitrificans]
MKNTALAGEYLPAHRPSEHSAWHKLDIRNQQAANHAPHRSPAEHIEALQAMLREGREHKLGAILDALPKRLRNALFYAAYIDKADLAKPFDQLTGAQRQQIYINLRAYLELVERLRKAGFWKPAAWNIGELKGLTPASDEEMQLIAQAKAARAEAARQRQAELAQAEEAERAEFKQAMQAEASQ